MFSLDLGTETIFAHNVQGLAKCGTLAFRLPGLLKLIKDLLFKLYISVQ